MMIEIAIKNGIKPTTYFSRVHRGWDEERAATKPVRKKYTGDYAVYKKGKEVITGSCKACADYLGVREETIEWLTTPTAIKRRSQRNNPEMAIAAVKLDEEDEDDE